MTSPVLSASESVFQGGASQFMAGQDVANFLVSQGSATPQQAARMTSPQAGQTVNEPGGQFLTGAQVAQQLISQGSATRQQAARQGIEVPTSPREMAALASTVNLQGTIKQAAQTPSSSHTSAVETSRGPNKGGNVRG